MHDHHLDHRLLHSRTTEKPYNSLTFQLGIRELGILHHLQQGIKGIILSCLSGCFLALSLTNLRPEDAESLLMALLSGLPLGLLLGLLLLQLGELHLDFLDPNGGFQLGVLSM